MQFNAVFLCIAMAGMSLTSEAAFCHFASSPLPSPLLSLLQPESKATQGHSAEMETNVC